MPVFEHVSHLPHPREEVFAWHTRPGGFVRLTPPGMARLVSGPDNGIEVGSTMRLVISSPLLAGLGLRAGVPWTVRHVEMDAGRLFVDEQQSGPFRQWRHEHHFADAPDGGTLVTDRVTWALPVAPPGAERLVTTQLRRLFGFRERQLRDDLALHAQLGAAPTHVAVTGASGLVGRQLCAMLTSGGHRVTRLVRGEVTASDQARWSLDRGPEPGALDGVDAVVHLAGEPIGGRFTAEHKRTVLRSRVEGTGAIARALAAGAGPRTLVSASAIGFYGPQRPGETLTESSARGTEFLADVVQAWEDAAQPASEGGVRVAMLRTGIALSGGGGALALQLPLFELGLGGRLTRADAQTSWVSLDDVVRSYAWALFSDVAGPLNATAPEPATQADFARTVGRALRRPALLPTPALGPKLVLGSEGYDQMIDTDQRVLPQRLAQTGFPFAHPNLAEALAHLLVTG